MFHVVHLHGCISTQKIVSDSLFLDMKFPNQKFLESSESMAVFFKHGKTIESFVSHRIHVWYIYSHLADFKGKFWIILVNVGKITIYGSYGYMIPMKIEIRLTYPTKPKSTHHFWFCMLKVTFVFFWQSLPPLSSCEKWFWLVENNTWNFNLRWYLYLDSCFLL